ncbi:hypothetical protein [Escherichia phage PJNS034]
MAAKLTIKRTEKDNFHIRFGNFETYLTFVELSEISEQIREVVSDEESRLLQAELSGSLVCDGCTI